MQFKSPALGSLLSGRDNNLNAIRMIAASMVLVSHAFPIALGPTALQPLQAMTGATLGHYSVAVFFGISGLLIARSFDRRRGMVHFLTARVLRLFPALLVVLVLTVIAGAAFTRLPWGEYFAQRGTWTYVPANLSLAFLQYPLPGVFETNPYGPPINGSLWTLFYEVGCYAGIVVLGLLGVLRHRGFALAALAMVTLVHFAVPALLAAGRIPLPAALAGGIDSFALSTFPFMLGTCAYVWRDSLRLSGWIALLLWVPAAFLAPGTAMETAITIALVYGTFWIGFVPKGALLAYNRLGDYSYGVYIYAFPVQQGVEWFLPGMSPALNIALALPVTLFLAVLSWNIVETRALAQVAPLAATIARRLGEAGPAVEQSGGQPG